LEDFTLALSLDELSAARDTASVDSFRFAMPQIDIAPTTIDFYERLGFDCDEFTMRKVFHAAAVAMDDKGIEAAAATAVEGWDDGGGEEPNRDFEVNRPFLFFVYDAETRFLTFAGRWLGPSD
ncbi:MAG TPA: serpin family protein, partial [Polyangiaceae bacterium]|nr:serpin family protein [Polyangiaceae bacterium]